MLSSPWGRCFAASVTCLTLALTLHATQTPTPTPTRNDCEQGIDSTGGSAGYHQVDDHCEGAYEVKKASRLLVLDSLNFVPAADSPNECSEDSTVRFGSQSQPVDVHARRLTGNPYRMDTHAQPGAKGEYRWKCNILKSAGKKIENVGVVVKLTDGSFYLPAAFSLGVAPTPTHRFQLTITSLAADRPTGLLQAIKVGGVMVRLSDVSFTVVPRDDARKQWRAEFEVTDTGQFELDVKAASSSDLRIPLLVTK